MAQLAAGLWHATHNMARNQMFYGFYNHNYLLQMNSKDTTLSYH
jgi:hypothetical protein